MGERAALILADPDDLSSEIVGRALQTRGCRSLRAGPAELALARWHHVPEGEGGSVALPDGRVLEAADIGVVLNRLDGVRLPQFAQAPADDRDYAVAEFSALLSSWLHGLDVPIANPPEGGNAWAAASHPLVWHALAVVHGLKTGDFVVASSVRRGACAGLVRVGGSAFPRGCDVAGWYRPAQEDAAPSLSVWVFGDNCVGLDDDEMASRCVAFVAALGLRCAALDFRRLAGELRLVGVERRPPLEDQTVAGRCADWLAAVLEGAQ